MTRLMKKATGGWRTMVGPKDGLRSDTEEGKMMVGGSRMLARIVGSSGEDGWLC